MSILGSIRGLKKGSGLEEALGVLFTENTVPQNDNDNWVGHI